VITEQTIITIAKTFNTLTKYDHHKAFLFLGRSVFLVIIFTLLLAGCGSVTNSPIPQIQIQKSNTPPEKRVISNGLLPQQNCGGNSTVTNEIERSHTIQFTLDISGGITVNGGGEAEIPGIGKVSVGTEVAGAYGVSYGNSTSLSRKLSVSAREGTNLTHNIQEVEYWQTGIINILIDGKLNSSYPYQFRTDFGVELMDTQSIPCSTATTEPSVIMPTSEPTQTNATTIAAEATALAVAQTARLVYGPSSGTLSNSTDATTFSNTDTKVIDFVAETTFKNPNTAIQDTWSYGIMFRRWQNQDKEFGYYYYYITSQGDWYITGYHPDNGKTYITGKNDNIDLSVGGSNKLKIVAEGKTAMIFINDKYIDTADISKNTDPGNITVGTGFKSGSTVTKTTDYQIVIRSLDN